MNAILTSKPNETAERETYYHLNSALQDLVGQLGMYVSEAEKLLADQQQEDE